ncbi:MAG: response regulator [Clostridia bacterium]|nr:response regulator [Clostridia bacterium]NCC43663.1 response regulator [Clostridia bacterium]
MKKINSGQRIVKLFSMWTLGLCAVGLFLNIVLANCVIHLGIPLYIDNVGSVFVAALGGPIPGMAVGFLSNLLNSAADPMSMYYGILTVFNALAAAAFSEKGYLKSARGCVLLACVMMLIGGAVGSVMTWMLYGGGIGGIAAPLANTLYARGIPVFWAQFFADMAIDIPDKLLTILPIYLFLHFYPAKLYDLFPNSYLYDRSEAEIELVQQKERPAYRQTSVSQRITGLIVLSVILVSGISIIVGIQYYQEELKEKYFNQVYSLSHLVAENVNGDRVDEYLSMGAPAVGQDEEYQDTRMHIERILRNMSDVEYIYVYQIREDGCHVVFDFDTEDVMGDVTGSVVSFDESFSKYYKKLIAGEEIDPLITNDSYGWLITAYAPIKNQAGETTAYGCVDISMQHYINDMLVFIIKMLSMLFGISLFICSFALWYAAVRITSPINSIVEQTRNFDRIQPQLWLESGEWKNRTVISTGDEIEELYRTVCNVQENISANVVKMKHAEKQLRLAYELEKKNKELALEVQRADEESAMKTEFYSRMSHDMRTPMNGIMGLVSLSKDEMDLDVLHENLEKIENSSNYLLALINDTLDMSKIETKKMQIDEQPVSVTNMIEGITDMLAPTMEKKQIRFVLQSTGLDKEMFLMMDEVRVKQIFMNLLSNSMKFTASGGMISLGIDVSPSGSGRKHFHIVLRDTGCGMSEEFIRNKLFKPFAQEQNSITITSAGSGLGLSIVKNLIEMMGGSIQVKSELGEGTEFVVEIDFMEAQKPQEVVQQKKMDDHKILNGKHILLCEDHPLNKEIIIKILNKAGVEVDYAPNGRIGTEKFREKEMYGYDAILMDVRMPVMDGITAAKVIRAMDREDARTIPIIAMTANAYAEDKQMTREAGMDEHLTKPINIDVLYQVLTRFIGRIN